jgi:transcriptional regulator with XRE-family HTH domain
MGRAGGKSEVERQFDLALGARLKELRTRRRVGQAELARSVGITPPQLHAYEQGRVRCSPFRLVLFASRLRVTVAELFPPRKLV